MLEKILLEDNNLEYYVQSYRPISYDNTTYRKYAAYKLSNGGFIKEGYHAELDEYKEAMSDGKKWLIDFEQREREKTGIKNLKVAYNRVFGYFISIQS